MGKGTSPSVEVARDMPIIIPRLDDPESASPDERDEHLMLLEAARQALEVEWTETMAVAEKDGDHDLFGYPSMVAYLKHRMGIAGGRAHRYVKNARAASRCPATFSAWQNRQISGDEAELMFRASERMPDKYPDAEPVLLEMVGDGVDETKRILDYWKSEADPSVLDLEDQLDRRHFDVTRRANGMVAGEFALPQLEGETLLARVDSLKPPPADSDRRTTTQRRADALGDLARSFLDGAASPMVGGERPHLNVHVDLTSLGGTGALHEATDGIVLDPALIDQISCDASVTRIVFGPRSEVLDVGRKTRVIPAALRRAVGARDRHCVAPGCRRSARWCDIHHKTPWSEGGQTRIDNLILLCRYHHTLLHLELFSLEDLEIPGRAAVSLGERST